MDLNSNDGDGDGQPADAAEPTPADGVAEDNADLAQSAALAGKPRKHRKTWKLALLSTGSLVLVLTLALTITGYVLYRHLDSNVHRVKGVFGTSGLPAGVVRPAIDPNAEGATNILLVGSDSRADQQTTGANGNPDATSPIGQRTDTMMLIHIDASKHDAWVVSIPRDAWVDVPGHGMAKINAAFAWGGATLMRATVEQLTGVRINHYAEIDFDGFQAMTDALGGVDVQVPRNFTSRGYTFVEGKQHMDGAMALAFVRDRYNQPGADFDRMDNQHSFMLALMQKALATSPFSNPLRLLSFLDAFTKNVSIDDTWSDSSLRSFAWSLRNLSSSNMQFIITPYQGVTTESGQSVVLLDPTADAALWTAMRTDTMQNWTP